MTTRPAAAASALTDQEAHADYLFNLSTVGEHNLHLMADPYGRYDYDAEQELLMDPPPETAAFRPERN